MNIEEVKEEIKKNGVPKFVNNFILRNKPICFNMDENITWEIIYKISTEFDVHNKNIEIIGSAKLGISLSKERFCEYYNDKSDIDVVIVSQELFNDAWDELLTLDIDYYKLKEKERLNLKECYNTIHRGFISPDRLPPSSFKTKWWKVFNELSNKPRYEYRKIRGRLFRNWRFVEKYQSIQIQKLNRNKNESKSSNISDSLV